MQLSCFYPYCIICILLLVPSTLWHLMITTILTLHVIIVITYNTTCSISPNTSHLTLNYSSYQIYRIQRTYTSNTHRIQRTYTIHTRWPDLRKPASYAHKTKISIFKKIYLLHHWKDISLTLLGVRSHVLKILPCSAITPKFFTL